MDEDEQRVASYMTDHGLVANRFSKSEVGKNKTPDFRVQRSGSDNLLFYCEVKSIRKNDWLGRYHADPESPEMVGSARKDPVFNRLTEDIHEAAKQFEAVNPEIIYPNVLAFVNHDRMCGFFDLIGVLTGNFMAEGGKTFPIYRLYSEGRIRQEKDGLHLFVWLDDFKPHRLLFSQTHENHHLLLCDCFHIEPSVIKQVG